jgi:hypothetical protein
VINLTEQEREKFILYLKQEIDSDKILLEQMKKINILEGMIKKKNVEVMAREIVIKTLTVEVQTLK